MTKQYRIRFDRNTYSVPPPFVGQHVVVRANDEGLAVFLGPKRIALHRRCWGVHEDLEDPAHRASAIEKLPRGNTAVPPALVGLGEIAAEYFGIFRATHRSIKREAERLTFLSEVFGERHTAGAMREVMQTGHVGAEYVEYVLRHKRKLRPEGVAVHLGKPEFDRW